jgi:hypothetical protein
MGGPGCPAIAIRSALASGVPTVAAPGAARYFPESIVGDCVGLNATPAELARKLVRLTSDASLRARVAGLARANLGSDAVNQQFAASVADAWSGHVGSAWREEAMRTLVEPAA